MKYRFGVKEPVGEAVRRIGLEQIEIAEGKLAGAHDSPAAIHDARRCLKRVRALLQLVRPALEDDSYRREYKRVRDIARLLSGVRDLHVMQQTAHKLESRFGPLPDGADARLRKLLRGRPTAAPGRASANGSGEALKRLRQMRKVFSRPDDHVGFGHLAEGMELAYEKGRRAFRKAYKKKSDEAFHSWRKSVQLHWRHMQLLSRGWPDTIGARASEAKQLSQLLGEDHDLSVLCEFVSKRGEAALSISERKLLVSQCRRLQGELRERAELHGVRLFSDSPADLRDRLRRYWASARRLSELSDEEAAAAEEAVARSRSKLNGPRSGRRGRQARGPRPQTSPPARTRP